MSSSKRPAPRTPEGPPAKRRATSSPEEGELDDTSSESPQRRTTSISTPPVDSNVKFKVPFPFKSKPGSSLFSRVEGVPQELAEPHGYGYEQRRYDRNERSHQRPAVYDRLEEQEYGDKRRNRGRRNATGDHYEPSYPTENRNSYYGRDRDRDYFDREPAERERYYSPPRKEAHAVASASLQSSMRSVSPRSRSRSRSRSHSISPQNSERSKPRHRLPTPRSTSFTTSPAYDDRQRDRNGCRGDYYEPYRRETYRDRIHDPRGQYQREELDDYDRYYRPEDSLDPEVERRRSRYSISPVFRPVSPSRPYSISKAKLPPSPPLMPPGPQENSETLVIGVKEEEGLRTHETLSISLRRPGAPRAEHSPPSLRGDVQKATPAPPPLVAAEPEAPADTPAPVAVKPKRVPVKRSREEEKLAYHRIFIGCGESDDYDVMTKLGEGTFGEVHKALHKETGMVVALKRILMHNEKDGMPVTALREIKILKALKHPCIVDLLDMFIIQGKGKESPMSVYMVFPYMDHDLAGLLENERVTLSPSQIKLYMKQLLEGTEYMHHNKIVHRDMKAANLLISNNGSLKIADFGLARAFDSSANDRRYTNCVVTRWYRPPELLLGARQYGGEIDIWGIGCVLGEMIMRRPILPGDSDLDQLEKIWSICGSPNQQNWPDYDKLPGCSGQIRFKPQERRVKQVYDSLGNETSELMDRLLTLDPRERITATDALDHVYFWSDPLPADPKSLPTYEASHEFDQRGRRHQAAVQKEATKPNMQRNIQPPLHNKNYRNEDVRQQAYRPGIGAPPYPTQNGFNNSFNGNLYPPPHQHLPLPPLHNSWGPGYGRHQPSWGLNGPSRQLYQGPNFDPVGQGYIGGDRNMHMQHPSQLPSRPPGLPPRPGAPPRPMGNRPIPSENQRFADRTAPPFRIGAHGNGSLNYG